MPQYFTKFFTLLLFLCCPIAVKAVVAGFTVDNAAGCTPLIVHFANTSTDATSYSWNLGNSTTSALPDPSASYVTAGTYTVTLTAYNGAASSTYSMVITVYPLPSVNFTANFTARCPGFPVTFTNASVAGTPGTTSYTWNFGDGSTSTITSPVYTHPSPGYYNITLFATNSMGCFSSLTKPSYIHVYTPPAVNFTGSGTYICAPPSIVSFANGSSGTPPLSYNWTFGDGSAASTGISPSHNYATAGSYNVRLRVTDGNGCIDSLFNPGYVYAGNLTASFTNPPGVCQSNSIDFNNTSSPHILREWDFGDGFTSTDEMPTYVYTASGSYNVRLIVNDGSCLDTVVNPITIHPTPSGTFTVTPVIPCPSPVTLNYAATISPGSIATWKFLDDATATGTSVNHTYISGTVGTRLDTMVLTLTSSFGCTKVMEMKDTVYKLLVFIDVTNRAGCLPLTTSFLPTLAAESFNPLTAENVSLPVPYVASGYTWNFADGSPTVTSPSPTHTYTAVGSYLASCTVTTTSGCTASGTFRILVGVQPTFSATATPMHICAGKRVDFASTASSNVNSYFWIYGDGGFDSGIAFSTTQHIYPNPAIDTVRAKGYHNGCPSPVVKIPIIIDSPNAVPSFVNACIPRNAVLFGDASIGADSRLWIFGDGDTSSLPIVTHNFPALLDYTVYLTTYNAASGCRDTVGTEVKLAPPFMYFFSPTTDGCIDQDVTLAAVIIGPPAAIQYHWYVDGVLAIISDADVASFPIHTPGLHDITLVILDDRGCFDTFSRFNYLFTGNPVASFTAAPPTGCGPLLVNFPNTSSGIPGAPLVSYEWTFGDGNPPLTTTSALSSHTYSAAGTYSVSLTVTDNIGCTSTTTPPVTLQVYRPHAAFYADFNNVCMGQSVHFNNISADIISSFWIYGDGNTSTAVSPYHTYTTSGIYTVKLVVTDSHGCNDTATLLNYIFVALSPHAAFTLSDSFAVCPPLNVNFTNTSTGGFSYSWNFGNSSSSVAVNPSSPYTAPGYYTVRLVASNVIGCRDTAYRHVNIFGYDGAFSYTPLSGCSPLPVHFSASLGSFASLVWDFGDGVTSSVSLSDTISHTYPLQGYYVPKLILTDTTGCTNFSIGADTIRADKVTPNFRITPNPVCQGSATIFTDSSYATFSGPSSWTWSFGGGATATGSSPAYTFTLAGTHVVTLSVTNGNGCTATVTKSVLVNSLPGVITGIPTVCVGYTTALTNSSPSGTWSSSAPGIANVSAGGIVSGLAVGTATIKYTLSAGCISSVVVTVFAVPGTITGASNVCEGSTTSFSNSTAGGTWSSSSPVNATVNLSSGLVTGILSGSAVITYTLGSGCNTVKIISVNLTPVPITGILSICKNATTALVESLPGGAWSSGAPTTAIIDAGGNVTGVNAGTAGVTYAFPTGCKTSTIVTVNPLPDTITGDLSLCFGFTTLLSNGTPGGTWTSGNTTIAVVHPVSGTVLGMGVGTANITYSLGTGCNTVKNVTVNAVPATISGTAVLCENATTTLYQSLPGGNWSSGNLLVATIDAAGIVSGISGGTARITYAFASGCAVSKVVTVNPLPDTITGNPSLCYGFISYLGNSVAGGTWTSSDPTVAPINSFGAVNAIATGTSTISYTLGTGCARGIEVTVNPLPDPITGVSNVCIGNPTHLSTTTTGGTWSSGDTSIATIGLYSGDYTGVNAGYVTITYTSAAGCITTKTITVQALPPPIGGGPTVCAGFAVNLSNTMPGGTWSSDPAASMIGTIHHFTGVVTGITPGTVSVTYTVMTGCQRNLVVTVLVLPPVISGSPNVCVGDTSYLSNAAPGGTWSCSNSRAIINPVTGAVVGVSAGPAVITYMIGTGCFNILNIMVNPLPTPIIGPGKVCEGATIVLFSGTPSGVWISGHTDTATVGYNTGLVTGIRAGTALISYALPTGCKVTKLMTVDQTPPAITGNPHICTGTSVTLSNTMPGGWWVSSNPGIATVDIATGVVTSVTLGTSYISYIIPATGCYTYRIVTVQPLPTVYNVTGGGNYCSGGTGVHVGLTGSQPGVSYVLYYGSSVSGYLSGTGFSLDFGSLTPGGVYTVHATNVTSGCQRNMAGSATISITPLVTPVVSINVSPDDTSCPGNSVTVSTVSLHGGAAPVYLWKVNGVYVGGATTYTYIPADADLVTVTMTSNANCLAAATATAALGLTVLPSEFPVVNVLVSPDDSVCQFGVATFAAAPEYGGSSPIFTWVVNGVAAGTGPTYSYVPLDGDVVYCSMISDYLCRITDTGVSGNVSMYVDPMTPPNVTIIPDPGLSLFAGQPVTLNTYVTNAGTNPGYQWKVNGHPVFGATNASYTAIFENQDSVVCLVTGHGICDGIQSFDWVFITTRPLQVQGLENVEADISLMPNPNNGNFTLRGIIPGKGNELVTLMIADVMGQVVYRGSIVSKGGRVDSEISMENELANGMYLLNLGWGADTKVFHFVIKR